MRPTSRGPVAVIALTAAVAAGPLRADVVELAQQVDGMTVEYKVVLPDDFDPVAAYPGVLVFGGGPQTMRTIDGTLGRNFRDEAERRGYIVVGVAAPNGQLFFQGGERILPAFLDLILADYRVEHGRFHAAGPSNGGIAALHVAAQYPEYFLSATAFPGYLWQPSEAKLRALAGICVFMYVGEHDEYGWHNEMEREAAMLTAGGTLARYSLEEAQGHRLETLAGRGAARLYDGFDAARQGCML